MLQSTFDRPRFKFSAGLHKNLNMLEGGFITYNVCVLSAHQQPIYI